MDGVSPCREIFRCNVNLQFPNHMQHCCRSRVFLLEFWAELERRKLELNAKVDSDSSYCSFKRRDHGPFRNRILMLSTCGTFESSSVYYSFKR